MLEIFQKWYERVFFEEESILLLVLLALGLLLLLTIGDILTPVLAALVLAYLMQGLTLQLTDRGIPQWLAVSTSFTVFIGIFFGVLFGLMPLIWQQLVSLFGELPRMLDSGRTWLAVLPEQYPTLITKQQISSLLAEAQQGMSTLGQWILNFSLSSIARLMMFMIYAILIPMLVFFFLKDRQVLLAWLGSFLPRERPLLNRIWREMDDQVANYARGKVIEIVVVGSVSYAAFSLLGLAYAALMGLLVGLSVIIPYIGATVVTLPVFMIGLFQWGLSTEFYTLMVVYFIIQGLDGNVLVPLLFSEAVNLHPVAIILAVVFFGGIWGIWGVFFAIPLATLVKAVINAWPTPVGTIPTESGSGD
jgi:putative permease